jgi:hypothetical protein
MRPAALLALVIALLALASCGDPLVTTYGSLDGDSVNGLRVLKSEWTRRFASHEATRLSSRLDRHDLLIHASLAQELPSDGACAWIKTWLEADDGRQFVLVLRDGVVSPWLCRRWAAEARGEAAKADGPEAERLGKLAKLLDERAAREEASRQFPRTKAESCPLVTLAAGAAMDVTAATGVGEGEAPPTLRMVGEPQAKDAEALTTAFDAAGARRAWAIAVPVGGSRLVVVANATPLVDGALVDHRARRMLDGLLDEIAAWRAKNGGDGAAGWVSWLTVREQDATPPNVLALLFGRPPFSWVVAHLVALTLVVLGLRAAWLGRVTAPPARGAERFSRHVEALASHLAKSGANRACTAAIAAHHGVTLESQPVTIEEARATAASLHRPQTAKHRRVRKPPPPKETA